MLTSQFGMTHQSDANICFGPEIEFNHKSRKFRLSQTKYASTVLTRFVMDVCRPVDASIQDCKVRVTTATGCSSNVCGAIGFLYREAICRPLCLRICTPQEICLTGEALEQFLENPTLPGWNAVEIVQRYIMGTVSPVLCFSRRERIDLRWCIDSDCQGMS